MSLESSRRQDGNASVEHRLEHRDDVIVVHRHDHGAALLVNEERDGVYDGVGREGRDKACTPLWQRVRDLDAVGGLFWEPSYCHRAQHAGGFVSTILTWRHAGRPVCTRRPLQRPGRGGERWMRGVARDDRSVQATRRSCQ